MCAIFVIHVPHVAHRRMAITDMRRTGSDHDSVGGTRLTAEHHVVRAEVQLFKGHRHQGQVFLIAATGEWKPRDKCGAYLTRWELPCNHSVVHDMRESIGVW